MGRKGSSSHSSRDLQCLTSPLFWPSLAHTNRGAFLSLRQKVTFGIYAKLFHSDILRNSFSVLIGKKTEQQLGILLLKRTCITGYNKRRFTRDEKLGNFSKPRQRQRGCGKTKDLNNGQNSSSARAFYNSVHLSAVHCKITT